MIPVSKRSVICNDISKHSYNRLTLWVTDTLRTFEAADESVPSAMTEVLINLSLMLVGLCIRMHLDKEAIVGLVEKTWEDHSAHKQE